MEKEYTERLFDKEFEFVLNPLALSKLFAQNGVANKLQQKERQKQLLIDEMIICKLENTPLARLRTVKNTSVFATLGTGINFYLPANNY